MPKRSVSVRDVSALKGCLLAIKVCVYLKRVFFTAVCTPESCPPGRASQIQFRSRYMIQLREVLTLSFT